MTEGPKINPGDIILWPMLKLDYQTAPGEDRGAAAAGHRARRDSAERHTSPSTASRCPTFPSTAS